MAHRHIYYLLLLPLCCLLNLLLQALLLPLLHIRPALLQTGDQSGPDEPGTDSTQEIPGPDGENSEDMSSDVSEAFTEESTPDITGNTEEVTTDILPEPDTTTMDQEPDTIPEPDTTADSGDRETVTFVISSGMISNTAAGILEELGVVESGYDFNMYLYNNGYESKLRVGTYEIPKGASYEEITRIITGGR